MTGSWDAEFDALVAEADLYATAPNTNGHTRRLAPVRLGVDDTPQWAGQLVDLVDWLATGPNAPVPLWGDADHILAARNQPTVIAGAQGAGKTVVAGRLMLGALGVDGCEELLGYPVTPTERGALYLACDRPDQARLSLVRMVERLEPHRGRAKVWPGPLPYDLVKNPGLILQMAALADASFVVIDSLKDVALRLSDDEVGAAVNRAVQLCVAEGIDVVPLHHARKLGGEDSDTKPRKLDDLYGAVWLTAGSGSVLYLHHLGGDRVELNQLKTPIGSTVEFTFRHNYTTGDVHRTEGARADVLTVIDSGGYDGVSISHIADCVYQCDSDRAQQAVVKRTVDKLLDRGEIEVVEGHYPANGKGKRYRAVDR